MTLKEGKGMYDYDERQKAALIEKLQKEYGLTEKRDYGSDIILENFTRTIKAEILIGGYEIQYRVFSLNN